ncbi:MAG: ferredoxin family protein [Chloroflexi bacterium]|nr:ferredoxin family protein [Chloroflexota bacterium]
MSEDGDRRQYRITVIPERCKGCGFCVEFCRRNVLRYSVELNSKGYRPIYADNNDECNGCDICAMICPDFAISVVSESDSRAEVESPENG